MPVTGRPARSQRRWTPLTKGVATRERTAAGGLTPWGHGPSPTARTRATPATGAERAGGRVGQDDVRARSLLSAKRGEGEK